MWITDHDVAIEAAEAGAAVVRSHYGSALTHFQKSAGDFATTADIEAEKAIVAVLRSARPNDLIVGEESGRTGTGGLVVAADEQTHAALLTLVRNQRT